MKTKIKKYFLIISLLQLCLVWANFAFAQTGATDDADSPDYRQFKVEESIKKYLCTPSEANVTQPGYNDLYPDNAQNQASGDLYNCINRLYKFAIAIGTSIGVFFIVLAGYVYIDAGGNEESITKAKSILTSTIAAMVILFSGYILLKAINPELVQFKPIQPKSILNLTVPTESQNTNNQYSTPLSNNLKEAAQKILNLDGKGININKTSCDCTNNCPINTLQSIAAGNLPQKDGSGSSCNTGKVSDVSLSMLNAILYAQSLGSNFNLGSITGGHHSQDSLHYQGKALDVTPIPQVSNEQSKLVAALRSSGAKIIALECLLNGSNQYLIFGKDVNDSDPRCMGKPNYHIHASW